jgi:membrane-bound lytic murein transglycosylase B
MGWPFLAPRPMNLCRALLAAAGFIAAFSVSVHAEEAETPSKSQFAAFLKDLWASAKADNISRETFDRAFAGVAPDPRVIALTARQPEYVRPVGDYVARIATEATARAGSLKASQWEGTLERLRHTYGVDSWVLMAVWGMESDFGTVPLRWDAVRSLATLAAAGYRDPYFRKELLLALKILESGDVAQGKMMGSWAGAMGQPQFMPSAFFDFAVDYSGDKRRDIWSSVPDVLASMSNYLQKKGWQAGLTWGYEVTVPAGFDYMLSRGSFAEWKERGVKRASGDPLPGEGSAILFFPSGAGGPGFLVTENFVVLKRYNNSDAYALAIGQLADRMQGIGPFRAAWPKDDKPLSRAQRIAVQKKLAELGYPVQEFQGHFDFDLRDAVRDVQKKNGFVPDGNPTPELMEKLGIPL